MCLLMAKVLDWYDDPTIQWATVGAVVAGILFVYIEVTLRNPYYQFDVLKLRTIRFGFLFYFLLMVLNSSSMFVNVFTGIGMKLDNYQKRNIGQLVYVGLFYRWHCNYLAQCKGVHFKYLFSAGFLFFRDYPPCSCTSRFKVPVYTNG